MNYHEMLHEANCFRQDYLDGLEKLILSRQCELAVKRKEYCKDIFLNQECYREAFKKMLGWPLVGCDTKDICPVKTTKLSDEDGYSIYRMRFEILDGLEMTGLYFEVHGADAKPLVLAQHGGLGTPELISGMYGSTENYNEMLHRVLVHGVHVFAPQLLLWDPEKYKIAHERRELDARLKRVGSSITAVELYGLMRILDYFETQDNISNFGMVGLSYGGFYTLFLSAIDTRIKSAISCSYFNLRDRYPWSDWTWLQSAAMFDDAEIACLIYPRKLCIEIGTRDALFDVSYGIEAFENLRERCKDVGTDWVDFRTFDGTHQFCMDDEPIQKLIEDLFSAG